MSYDQYIACDTGNTEHHPVRSRCSQLSVAQPRVFLVDPEILSLETFGRLLQDRCPDFEVAGGKTADAGRDFNPSLVLIDIKANPLPSEEAEAALSRAREVFPHAHLVVKTDIAHPDIAQDCAALGIAGCLPASLDVDTAIAAIRLVLCGHTYYPAECGHDIRSLALPDKTEPAGRDAKPDDGHDPGEAVRLTTREREVISKLREGKPNKIIAHELQMSLSTVKVHLRNIMRKMQATNRMQVALYNMPSSRENLDEAMRMV